MVKIQLVDKNVGMCAEWKNHFHGYDNVSVYCSDFFSKKTDCIVSPGNSFGFMDGSLDLAISKHLGWQVQEKLKSIIRTLPMKEILVGEAILVETDFPEIPYCIAAPTMRIPMIINETPNSYLASKAVFNLLKNNPQIQTVTISGLATGVGKVPFKYCARQMKMAYDEVILDQFIEPRTWVEALTNHTMMLSDIQPY